MYAAHIRYNNLDVLCRVLGFLLIVQSFDFCSFIFAVILVDALLALLSSADPLNVRAVNVGLIDEKILLLCLYITEKKQ